METFLLSIKLIKYLVNILSENNQKTSNDSVKQMTILIKEQDHDS